MGRDGWSRGKLSFPYALEVPGGDPAGHRCGARFCFLQRWSSVSHELPCLRVYKVSTLQIPPMGPDPFAAAPISRALPNLPPAKLRECPFRLAASSLRPASLRPTSLKGKPLPLRNLVVARYCVTGTEQTGPSAAASAANVSTKKKGRMVGTGRFELPTPRTPSECSTRLSHVPTQSSRLAESRLWGPN